MVAALCGHAYAEAPASLTTAVAPAAASTANVPTLVSVVIEGATAYSFPQLFATYRDQIGQPITREGARAISTALSDAYARDGFVRPDVRLDDSLTSRGVLRIRVFEAQVTAVVFEGETGRHRAELERIGSALTASKPLRSNDIPKSLGQMREIAGLAITANTRRDDQTPNAYQIVVRSDYSALEGIVRVNNRGTDQVGPNFMLGQLFANGLLGRREKIGLVFASATDPEEYLGGGLYVDAPLGDGATHANLLAFRSHSAPNEAPVDYAYEYLRDKVTLKLVRPLFANSPLTLRGSVGIEMDDLVIEDAGAPIREDRLRVIEGSLRSSWRGGQIQYSAGLQVRKGLDGLGAGLQAPDLLDDPRRADFLMTQLNGTAYRRLGDRWSLRLDAFAQHSGYVLPDSERFKIGGDRLGRGFEVAEIAGDKGLGAKVEARRDLVVSDGFFGRMSTYAFYDFGAAWKQDAPGRESATTAGTGFALNGAKFTGYFEIAAPLTGTDVEGKRKTSVFAEISYRF